MEEAGKDDEKQQAEMEEAYRKMLMDLESDDEDVGSAPKKEEEKKENGASLRSDDKSPLLSSMSSLNAQSNNRLGTPPPPPPPITVQDCDQPQVTIVVPPSNPDGITSRRNASGGRTSPSGRTSPLKNNRVEPLVVEDAEGEEHSLQQLQTHKNNNFHAVLTDKNQAFELSKQTNNGKVSTPDSGVDSLGSDKRPSVKTITDASEKRRKSSRPSKVFVRTFKQRASQENFALYGLLTPALCLVPKIDGHDALTETFTELRGEDRELKLAAAHIDDAISGRGKYGKARAFFKSKKGRWCFKMINSKYFKYLVLFMATLHLVLTAFEPPTSTSEDSSDSVCNVCTGSRTFAGSGCISPAILALTPLCIFIYTLDVGVHMGFLSWPVFWSLDENKWVRREFIFTCMYIIDYLMLVTDICVDRRLAQPFRCLRAAIILCKLNNVQHIWDVVMSIVIKLGKVFFSIILFIIIFSAIGVHLYADVYNATAATTSSNCTGNETDVYVGAFDHVGITSVRLFVLLTTENYPDIMIPAFTTNPWNFFYFWIFLFVGVFFLTAVLLAIIVDSYWSYAKKHVKKERARERAELAKAWNLLDPLGQGSLPKDDGRFLKLLQILKPHHTEEMNLQLIDYLDHNDDGLVDSLQWTIRLNEALSFEFEEDKFYDMDTDSPKCVYMMQMFGQKIVRSPAFSRCVLVLILIHCVLFCLKWYNMSETAMLIIQLLKTSVLSIFVVEAFLRVIAEGKNLLQVVDILDICLIGIGLGTNIPNYFILPTQNGYIYLNIISGLAVMLRLGFNSAQTKKIVIIYSTKVFPVMFDLILLVFIIIYFYSVLGWELFFNITPDTSYDAGVYAYDCGIGFDTFPCSILMIIQIVTTSNWHEIMNAAMVATTQWACLYFITCFITINMVVMNLFVAIAIEAFNKLGTDKEAEKNQDPEKKANEEESFAGSAITFINNFFESSRSEQQQEKEKMAQRPVGSPRMRRPSRVPVILEEEEHEEKEEDLSGLSREERKKRQMKKKREKRKNKIKTMIVVMTAFNATKDSELNLNVGEQIEIVGKQDEWWEGRKSNDEQGWFPASHVRQIKQQQAPPVPTPYAQRPHVIRKATSDSLQMGWSDTDTDGGGLNTTGGMNATQDGLMSTRDSITSTDSITKRPKLKLKNTSGGNWRKEILGDITVMNPQELKELNKILKSQHSNKAKSQHLNSSLGGSLRRQATISESIEEESEPVIIPSVMLPPTINVHHAPSVPQIIEEEEEPETEPDKDDSGNEGDSEHTLTVEKPELPKELKKKRNKEQTKNGEMPSWATNFLMSNNIKASPEVKAGVEDEKMEGAKGESSKEGDGVGKTAEEQV